jgi:diguanylate cyclase (GGDEF)-like protein
MTTIVGQATAYARRTVVLALSGATLIVSLILIERSVFDRYSFIATERMLEANAITNEITLAHERLMHAADMAAATAEQNWIDTYAANLPTAENAIRNAMEMARPEIAERLEAETKASHDRLVELDRHVFDAVRDHDTALARSIIADSVYQYHKQIVADGTARFVAALIASTRDDLRRVEVIELGSMTGAIAISIIGAIILWWRLNASLIESEDAQLEAEKKIKRLAMHDVLTGLANRISFRQGLQDATNRASTQGTKLAVLMIDLDRFKPVNDRYGHLVGDLVLKEVGTRLRKVGRAGELRGRFGGDEFVAIIEYERDDDIPRNIGERIVRTLSEPMVLQGATVEIGASVGIAIYPNDAATAEELVGKSDMALYRAKSDGRGTVRSFDSAMSNDLKARDELESELGRAIKTRAIVPYYQPIINLATGQLSGFEVLARWQHETKGLLLPDAFIKLSEKAGLANDLTLSVLQRACLDIRMLPAGLTLAVNVAPRQLMDGQLAHKILAVVSKTKFQPSRLEVELTETALLNDLAGAREAILALKGLGIQVVLDDFGTGYSSLGHLSDLPFDKIKIDRSFIQSFHTGRYANNTVRAIIGLGKSLGIPTIAEGIESERDAAAVRALDCTLAQGYFYSKPVPASELPEIIARFAVSNSGSNGARPAVA